jgi:hypothetical protein
MLVLLAAIFSGQVLFLLELLVILCYDPIMDKAQFALFVVNWHNALLENLDKESRDFGLSEMFQREFLEMLDLGWRQYTHAIKRKPMPQLLEAEFFCLLIMDFPLSTVAAHWPDSVDVIDVKNFLIYLNWVPTPIMDGMRGTGGLDSIDNYRNYAFSKAADRLRGDQT